MKFVLVLLEDCSVSTILKQIEHVNLWQVGIEAAIRQIVDIVAAGMHIMNANHFTISKRTQHLGHRQSH